MRRAVVGAISVGLLGVIGLVGPAVWTRTSASGRLYTAEQLPQKVAGSTVEVQAPLLALSVSDLRGLEGAPRLTLTGAALAFNARVPHVPTGSWLAAGVQRASGGQLQLQQAQGTVWTGSARLVLSSSRMLGSSSTMRMRGPLC